MGISDDLVSEVFVGVDDGLTDRRGAEVSDMERFPGIGTDIVDDNGFVIGRLVFGGERTEYIHPKCIGEKEVHIPAHNRDIFEMFGMISESLRDFFSDKLRCKFRYFGIWKDAESEISQLFFWRNIQ